MAIFLNLSLLLALALPGILQFQVKPNQQSGRILFLVNGSELDPESLKHEIFCFYGDDEFELIYEPGSDPSDEKYRISGLHFWAQLELGAPTHLASLPATKAGKMPGYRFRFRDLLPDGLSESGVEVDLIRASFSPGPIIAQGSDDIESEIEWPTVYRHMSFIMVLDCEENRD